MKLSLRKTKRSVNDSHSMGTKGLFIHSEGWRVEKDKQQKTFMYYQNKTGNKVRLNMNELTMQKRGRATERKEARVNQEVTKKRTNHRKTAKRHQSRSWRFSLVKRSKTQSQHHHIQDPKLLKTKLVKKSERFQSNRTIDCVTSQGSWMLVMLYSQTGTARNIKQS